jgi:HK97 family phage prohead protease
MTPRGPRPGFGARFRRAAKPRLADGTRLVDGPRLAEGPPPLACERKFSGAPLARVDEDGRFEGYASLFGIVDLGQDRVLDGAFRESLARRGAAGVKMLWSHDPNQPIGLWEAIGEDLIGLHVRGRLNLEVQKAREAHALMRSGAVDGLSIGFKAEKARRDPHSGVRTLERVDLWEVSIVTFPMLPQARVTAHAAKAAGARPFATTRFR